MNCNCDLSGPKGLEPLISAVLAVTDVFPIKLRAGTQPAGEGRPAATLITEISPAVKGP